MLPKVASHLLHHTSRAVAAVQSQTGHTIRNVLQSGPSSAGNLGSWNGPSSSNSNWGSTGSGTGGAKFSSSSRYHSGYTSNGRVVSHADPTAANSATIDYSDEATEAPTSHSTRSTTPSSGRRRARSTSVSLLPLGHKDQEGSLGVLKTVQDHIRARHAFAVPPKNSQSTEQYTIIDPVPPPSDIIESDPSVGIKESEVTDTDSVLFASLNAAERSGDLSRVVHEVQKLRNSSSPPSTAVYNAALQALYAIRTPGEPIFQILETYNNMLAQSITPNYRTYAILILALTDRDNETHKAILHIQGRMRRRTATGTLGGNAQATDEQRIVRLRSENNFGSALTLFQAASLIPRTKPHIALYTNLLRSCANHANIDAAIHVFAHLEKRTDLTPSPLVYGHLISVYTNAGDLQGAEEVFEEFKKASAKQAEESKTLARPASERWGQISVWNDIIVAYFRCGQPASALAILEQMMDSAAGEEFGVADVPPPSSATFSAVISGFCQSGDIASAISWFDKLLQQEQSSVHPHEPTVTPTKPDQHAWNTMLDALAVAGQVKDLNRFFEIATQTGVEIRIADRIVTLRANFFYVESLSITEAAEGVELLDFVVKHILEDEKFCKWPAAENGGPRAICEIITKHYVRFGQPEKALKLAEMCIPTLKALLTTGEASGNLDNDSIQFRMKGLRNLAKTLSSLFFKDTPSSLSLSQVLRIGHLCIDVGVAPSASYSLPYLNAYMSERGNEPAVVPLGPEWELLLWAAFASDSSSAPSADASEQAPIPADASEQAPNSADASEQVPIPADVGNNTVETLLGDMSHHQADLGAIPKQARRKVAEYLSSKYSISGAKEFLQNLGAGYIEAFGPIEEDSRVRISASDIPPLASPPQAAPTQHVHVDLHHSSFVDEYYSKRYDMTPMIGYNRFEAGMRTGVYPSPEVLGRLINGVGRLGYVDKVRKLYDAAQLVLATLERDKHWQSVGWFQVEDQMIIALAHAGDTDAAHIHRNRILAEGGTPSADAYGALIQKVRDTTDDTANAMTLFQEAATRGVRPNIYLYNTMISKLAKARKADHALELFQEMKTRGVRPTSVTYGAVIAACCRVGDVQSAELLFKEMATQPNFRPRVPPYNTMIQLFTHTKPDRERALYYYKALQKVGVQPTAHTYKLLIDAYGTVEPVDMQAMEDVFNRLLKDGEVAVQGTHWAALINAWGCVKKDLDKAIAIFDSIATTPSAADSNVKLPDAVCFEALLNVLVTLRRSDLIPVYCNRLTSYGIHMTAYIANLLIKGYAAVGDLEKAREVFESLLDPPEGVAAPNNHATHDAVPNMTTEVPANSPVFREPSTWEAMVRAELGVGNREQALELLERVQARRFPPAVYNRISGIMLDDDAVSPWSSSGSESPSL